MTDRTDPQTAPLLITRITIAVIVIVQLILGAVFIVMPDRFPVWMGLEPAPSWTSWIFAQFGARCLGFAYGMVVALRQPRLGVSWFIAMIVVQIVDWFGTLLPLFRGDLQLSQVSTAPFLPVLFVLVLGFEVRRQWLLQRHVH